LTNCLFEIKNQFEKTILFQQVSKWAFYLLMWLWQCEINILSL
jgi:hypothetical protein